jgi:hypothetical protein
VSQSQSFENPSSSNVIGNFVRYLEELSDTLCVLLTENQVSKLVCPTVQASVERQFDFFVGSEKHADKHISLHSGFTVPIPSHSGYNYGTGLGSAQSGIYFSEVMPSRTQVKPFKEVYGKQPHANIFALVKQYGAKMDVLVELAEPFFHSLGHKNDFEDLQTKTKLQMTDELQKQAKLYKCALAGMLFEEFPALMKILLFGSTYFEQFVFCQKDHYEDLIQLNCPHHICNNCYESIYKHNNPPACPHCGTTITSCRSPHADITGKLSSIANETKEKLDNAKAYQSLPSKIKKKVEEFKIHFQPIASLASFANHFYRTKNVTIEVEEELKKLAESLPETNKQCEILGKFYPKESTKEAGIEILRQHINNNQNLKVELHSDARVLVYDKLSQLYKKAEIDIVSFAEKKWKHTLSQTLANEKKKLIEKLTETYKPNQESPLIEISSLKKLWFSNEWEVTYTTTEIIPKKQQFFFYKLEPVRNEQGIVLQRRPLNFLIEEKHFLKYIINHDYS